MRLKDILIENKKDRKAKKYNIKPRNPMGTAPQTGAGAHRDKKKEQKQGYEKHKGRGVSEGSGTAKYKVRSIGTDSRGEYYISPSTGQKVYKSGVKVGDHENPKTGEIKPK